MRGERQRKRQIYADTRIPLTRGQTIQVAEAGLPTVTSSVEGSPALEDGGEEDAQAAGSGLACEPGNPACGDFAQDAYDDAYY